MSATELEGARFETPIPLKIRRVLGLLQAKSYVGGQTPSHRRGLEAWRWECKLRCRCLSTVQNYEVHPGRALFCFKTGCEFIKLNKSKGNYFDCL
ncbi:hypothetical protein AVEN_229934-1 [Araneus ventricosus]|uniref:Uncharacterized protein n=1 Tax=Araneus ventricosus TaxID=182803 RepID=A0A4Y2BYS9_ARAVE|nr:hypothetical protein AVEN_229934-1 [Araneus ventricosus]